MVRNNGKTYARVKGMSEQMATGRALLQMEKNVDGRNLILLLGSINAMSL